MGSTDCGGDGVGVSNGENARQLQLSNNKRKKEGHVKMETMGISMVCEVYAANKVTENNCHEVIKIKLSSINFFKKMQTGD